jgi:hypothetical protein
MSLEEVLKEKVCKTRYKLLSDYLKNNLVGELNCTEELIFKHLFEQFYTPDEGEEKFNSTDITCVDIKNDSRRNKYFSICVNNNWYPVSIKRLSGSKRGELANLIRAMRFSIEEQIREFRKLNPLNPRTICPITNNLLGLDAQVDHIIPFHIIANDWLKTNKNVLYIYHFSEMNYILQEPYLQQWLKYHMENAKLRWVSKEGNQYAHKL